MEPPGPPDCSPEAMAAAGSGVDPRCLGQQPPPGFPSGPQQPPKLPDNWGGVPPLEGESSGEFDYLEPPQRPYPGEFERPGSKSKFLFIGCFIMV